MSKLEVSPIHDILLMLYYQTNLCSNYTNPTSFICFSVLFSRADEGSLGYFHRWI